MAWKSQSHTIFIKLVPNKNIVMVQLTKNSMRNTFYEQYCSTDVTCWTLGIM